MKTKLFFIVLTIVLLATTISIDAIPAFARKYNMSCQTCHNPFPKLKAYGDTFAGNGFALADKDAPRYFVETGDPELSLIRDLPLAIKLEGYATYNSNKSEQGDFKTPYVLKLMSGGELAKDISYYFYFFFSERGEVAGIEDAFIMFNDVFPEFDIYVGQFQVSDPLFKRELRLTFEDYQIYKPRLGYSNVDLTYDRGIMLTYTFPFGTDLIFEVLNGSGIGGVNNFRNFDNDNYKNFALRASHDFSDNIRLGVFGYYGKEKLEDDLARNFTNEVTYIGPDLTLSYDDKLELNFQYLIRTDKQSFYKTNDIKTKGGFAELIYSPDGDESKYYFAGIYNFVESDIKAIDYKSIALSGGYLLKRNIRLMGEIGYDIERKFSQLTAGVITAF